MPGKKSLAASAAEYTSLAFALPAGTLVGYVIGYLLDRAFSTTWLKIVFLILGSAGGFVQLIRQIMRDAHDEDAPRT